MNQVLEELGVQNVPTLNVWNKVGTPRCVCCGAGTRQPLRPAPTGSETSRAGRPLISLAIELFLGGRHRPDPALTGRLPVKPPLCRGLLLLGGRQRRLPA